MDATESAYWMMAQGQQQAMLVDYFEKRIAALELRIAALEKRQGMPQEHVGAE